MTRTATTSASTRDGSPAPGVEHHIHLHVVPRWGGDTNFMPVIADTRVMPQTLEQSYEALRGGFMSGATGPRAPRDLQGIRHPRPLRRRDGRDHRAGDRPRVCARAGTAARQAAGRAARSGSGRDMRLTAPAMAAAAARGADRRGGHRAGRGHGRHRDALPPGRLARASTAARWSPPRTTRRPTPASS